LMYLLTTSASRLGSASLSAVALKVSAAEDHFVKVRQIIKDLMAKLEADKMNEATQRRYCDKNMAEAITERDDTSDKLEEIKTKLSGQKALEAQLTFEIASLQQAIADNAKALYEATELRLDEKATNTKTLNDAGEGVEAAKLALQILHGFYSSQGSLLQVAYVPPHSDREGNTVADLSPEIFDEGYGGKQKESKGIIGLLEIIVADFVRTGTTVTDQEALSEKDFLDLKDKTNKDTAAKEGEVTTKSGVLTATKDAIVTSEGDNEATASLKQSALESLESLKNMCVDGEETYAERVAARNKEIEALKGALIILREWQN